GEIDRSWGIASFTSLVSRQALSPEEVADRDTLTFVPSTAEIARSEAEKLDAYSIPRGARTGTLLHKIFELIDFQADDRSIRLSIAQVMEAFGFDEKWGDTIFTVVTNVLATDFGNFRLSDISRDSRLMELEFYLPLKNMTPRALRDVFQDGGTGLMDITAMLGRLKFDPVQGYLRGFMDLVFCHGGRYYLLDWKSNYLGSDRESYGRDALQGVMHRDCYVLQYHLYTLALDQYLRRTMTGYSYHEHFAGVYYVFLRGVDPDAGADYGIVSARPDEAIISRLRESLIDWPQSSVRGDLSG
ncbi:MAG: exodeoxyribonuclease V subunit beta, partial [Desulfomonilia bacterium]|nr:exodeoxyribonuclease V subunit beta [Desulfomonilia bacterium]